MATVRLVTTDIGQVGNGIALGGGDLCWRHGHCQGSSDHDVYGKAEVSGRDGIAIGSGAKALYNGTVALGAGAQASTAGTMALGKDAKATGSGAIAIGHGAETSGSNSVVIGTDAKGGADATNSVVLGKGAAASSNANTILGAGANDDVLVSHGGSSSTPRSHGIVIQSAGGLPIPGSTLPPAAPVNRIAIRKNGEVSLRLGNTCKTITASSLFAALGLN